MHRVETEGIIDHVQVLGRRKVRLLGGRCKLNEVSARIDLRERRTEEDIRHAIRLCVQAVRNSMKKRGGTIHDVYVIHPAGIDFWRYAREFHFDQPEG